MMSWALISKIHCTLSANQKRVKEFILNWPCALCSTDFEIARAISNTVVIGLSGVQFRE